MKEVISLRGGFGNLRRLKVATLPPFSVPKSSLRRLFTLSFLGGSPKEGPNSNPNFLGKLSWGKQASFSERLVEETRLP